MSYWISNIKNPAEKVVRKATAFSGSRLNIYPWPVASVVTRVFVDNPNGMNTGPLIGTQVGALTDIVFNPVRVGLNNYASQGQYADQDGVYVLNPSNIPYLRINFGNIIGPTDVYVEGFASSTSFKSLVDVRPEVYSNAGSPSVHTRVLTGDSSAITSAERQRDPTVAFRPVGSTASNGKFSFGGTLTAYIAADVKFNKVQINLGSESYTRQAVFIVEYWNGTGWVGVSSVATTVSRYDDISLVLQQSGVITFAMPSDWAKSVVAGDPYTNVINQASGSGVGNYTYSNSQYWLRLRPASGTSSDNIPVNGISILS